MRRIPDNGNDRNDAVAGLAADPMGIGEARVNLTEVINRVRYRNERIPITRNNQIIAYIVSPEDFLRITESEAA